MASKTSVPTLEKLIKPVIQALLELGGSGSIEEINDKVYTILSLSDKVIQIVHGDDGRTEIEYRLAWARTYLKNARIIENSARKIWSLKVADTDLRTITSDDIIREVRSNFKKDKISVVPAEFAVDNTDSVDNDVAGWKSQILSILQKIEPDAFERLAQRILRESGFIQVEVTGKTGDGGIDGKGIVRISGFLSFHVIFQCKRYKGSVSPSQIRDFRGAMQGRADKGLFITTGTFTREAIKEATRDGAPPIDLIDGDLLCDKLKELGLGLQVELVETVRIKEEWFKSL